MSLPQDDHWSELMQKAQAGDSPAYQILLEEISMVLKGYIYKQIGKPGVIEDILQESLLAIHQSRHTYQPHKSFSNWMYAITKYKIIDYFRKSERTTKREVSLPDELENFPDHSPAPSSLDLSDDIKTAIEDLPAKQKEALKLLKIKGLSVKEAAAQTGQSQSALKVSAHRAYQALKKSLKAKSHENN